MTPATTRALRRGLLVLVGGVVAAVAWSIRKPTVPPPVALPATAAAGVPGTSVGELVLRRFKGEHEGFVLKAKKTLSQEGAETRFQGVDVEVHYVERGEPGKAHITADECRYSSETERAVFQGSVHVVTADGFELDSESLIYRGDKGLVKTADPIRFKRGTVSGTSTGMDYREAGGEVELPADVFVRIEDDTGKGPATEIRSARANVGRDRALLRFEDDVRVVQGDDSLKAEKLTVNLNAELTAAYRAVATGDVELLTKGAAPLPGLQGTAQTKGARLLKGNRLDVWFRDDHTLKEATASPDAELLVMPGPRDPPENRRVRSRVLAFRFDEQGRMVELQAQKDAVATVEPLRGSTVQARSVAAGNFVAQLDPETGAAKTVDFEKTVEFKEGTRSAHGASARYEGERDTLLLRGNPDLSDESDGSVLKARTIEITNATGDIAARDQVRHTRRARTAEKGKSGFLGSDSAPTVIVADKLDYASKTKKARYEGKALLRSGKDEVRAETIVLEEPAPESRRLTAIGSVVSLLHPRPKDPGEKPSPPIEGRAAQMVYEEARGQILYDGEVTLRQGEIKTKSPKATVTLDADGGTVKTLVAGEPVEVEQGERHATGTQGTYTPENETMVLVGEKVTFKDPGQQLEGRTLTFHLGDDRILVDGQEQVRTEAVIRRQPKTP
ncbi:MAG TPA: LPS export ABC transporter periplasmic protein LptC [Vicinamibacteria bacterium]|nr:LPS export ABC transporter periplasmic protein LptC [Vicinamibacteria bacterium]